MKLIYIYIVAVLMLSSTIALAQGKERGRSSFGIIGGVNLQNLNGKDIEGTTLENDMIVGYHIGVNMQIPIAPDFYIQPGLLFTTKGAKNTTGGITSTYNISYAELPLNFMYKGMVGKGYIMLGAGPYLGYGVAGKTRIEGGPETIETDIEFTNVVEPGDPFTTTFFKALDAGANIFAGYEMAGGLFLQLNAQLGLLEINPEDQRLSSDASVIKNTGFGLSIGYRF